MLKKMKRKRLAEGGSPKVVEKDYDEKIKKSSELGKDPNVKTNDKFKNIFKKSDGSMENKVMEKIGKEADNVLKEKLLKGQDDEKAEIETMKGDGKVTKKDGFKGKVVLLNKVNLKIAKNRMEITLS
jgi:hypothetical protein